MWGATTTRSNVVGEGRRIRPRVASAAPPRSTRWLHRRHAFRPGLAKATVPALSIGSGIEPLLLGSEACDRHVDQGADLGGYVPAVRIDRDNFVLRRLII